MVDPKGIVGLHGSVALVTGASGALGAHFARVLAAAGAWWLAGAPHTEAAVAAVLPLMACMALGLLLASRLFAAPATPW